MCFCTSSDESLLKNLHSILHISFTCQVHFSGTCYVCKYRQGVYCPTYKKMVVVVPHSEAAALVSATSSVT